MGKLYDNIFKKRARRIFSHIYNRPMQIPRLYKAGRSAHAFIWWLPVAMLTAVLWMGCNKSADETKQTGGEFSPPSTAQPVAAANNEATKGGETTAGLVPNVEETSAPTALEPPVAIPVAVTPVAKKAPAQPLPANAKYLPSDSHMIFSINVGQMQKKLGEDPSYEDIVDEIWRFIKEADASGPFDFDINI